MKLLRLKLKNFASIWAGMNKKEVDIDFRKCQNKVVLLVGKNGSGKTSLLSNMHPFPHLGTLDLRNNQDLIREGLDGYKLFECSDGKTKYKIEHYYLWNNGKRKIVSYIKKNGIELNSSGSVKTFTEIINLEMGLDPSFLKILRLGPNIIDIINLKASERKDFISTLLADAEIYQQLYKVANEESKLVKNSLKIATSKFDKLDNGKDLELVKKQFEANLDLAQKDRDSLIKAYYTQKAQVENKILSHEEIKAIKTKAEENKQLLTYLPTFDKDHAKEIIDQYHKYDDQVKTLLGTKETLNFMITQLQETCVEADQKITDYQNKLKVLKHTETKSSIQAKITEYSKAVQDLEKKLLIHTELNSVETYVQLLNEFNIIKHLRDVIYEYPMQALEIIKDKAIGYDEKSLCYELDEIATKKMIKLSEKLSSYKTGKKINPGVILYVPEECQIYEKCPYYKAIYKDPAKKESYESISIEFEIWNSVKKIISVLENIRLEVEKINSMTKDKVLKLTFLDILVMILNHQDEPWQKQADKYQVYIDAAQVTLEINNTKALLQKYQDEKKLVFENATVDLIEKEIADTQNKLVIKSRELATKQAELDKVNQRIEKLYISMDRIVNERDYSQKILDQYNELTQLTQDLNRLAVSDKYNQALIKMTNDFNARLITAEHQLKINKDALNEVLFTIQEKAKVQAEKEALAERYEYTEIIRDSLSSTKGIPLIFIQLHLKNIQILANQIIHEMFDKNISLNDFIITEKEFAMPYTVNGITISDVSVASQGERTTIVMALSFAILQQFMTKYNIILLDEMDGPLYKENKEKFIRIVEREMEKIGAEQIVMITHNNLFEDYPVDLICTSRMDDNDYSESNIIWEV